MVKPLVVKLWLMPAVIVSLFCMAMFVPWLVLGKVLAPFDIIEEMYLPWRGDEKSPTVHNHFVSDAVTQYLPYRLLAGQS